MQKNSRTSQRPGRAVSVDIEKDTGNQSYFQWREQTVRMPAVQVTRQPSEASSLVRLFRRISGKV